MISSAWNEQDAQEFVARYHGRYSAEVALRTYSARLLGSHPELVLHGGGNTSVKGTVRSIHGRQVPAIFVKGSGWDLATIEPAGHPGLDLEYLRSLRAIPALSDEVMVNELRTHLFDAAAPTPSVETLLHAFLPARYVDHSHADAIITLTNTPNGEALVRECFGDLVAIVPYVMPGFQLGLDAARIFDAHPQCQGLVLLKHGLFTFGDTARESYERHLELVNRAEAFVSRRCAAVGGKPRAVAPRAPLDPALVLPLLRGALALRNGSRVSKRFVTVLRSTPQILNFVNDDNLPSLAASVPLTPDHVIRTKPWPLILELSGTDEEQLRTEIRGAVIDYGARYVAYVEHSLQSRGVTRTMLDDRPRIVLIPGLGLVAVGESAEAAAIAADIYEHTIAVKTRIAAYSSFAGLSELDIFDVEYWSLEQAKLLRGTPKLLAGKIAVITGGAGAIGRGIARVFKAAGATVVVLDRSEAVTAAAEALSVTGIAVDVREAAAVEAAFAATATRFGGIDIVVANAGVATTGLLETVTSADLDHVFQVNIHGYVHTLAAAARYLRRQGTGGDVIVVSSKNVFAPGKEFGLYSASKAAGHQLGKIAALELAPYNVRVNMLAPDAVFADGATPSGLWEAVGPGRAKARGLAAHELEAFYRERNLLKASVSAEDVGRAALFFASEQTPTTGASLAIDGGVAEAFVR